MSTADTVSTDVLIIGGGPSGLATAIHLADLLKSAGLERRILLIEKGASVGSHILSGAVIKTDIFRSLLPDVDFAEIPFNARKFNFNLCQRTSFRNTNFFRPKWETRF